MTTYRTKDGCCPPERLIVWRCPRCGELERATGRWRRSPEFKGGEPTPEHWHFESDGPRGFVKAEEVVVIPVTALEEVEAEGRKLQVELERVTSHGFLKHGGSLIEVAKPLLDELDRKWSRPVEVAIKDGELIFRNAVLHGSGGGEQ